MGTLIYVEGENDWGEELCVMIVNWHECLLVNRRYVEFYE